MGFEGPMDIMKAVCGIAGMFGMAYGLLYFVSIRPENIEREKDRIYQHASKSISHLDGKLGTSAEDWGMAYGDVLGRNFDTFTSPREQLSNRQLESISTHYSK